MTKKLGHKPLPMRLRDNQEGITKTGDYAIETRDAGVVFVIAIPYGKERYVLSEWTIDHKNHCDAQWSWDGDREKPSLLPSLHAVNVWHGWVKKGMLVEA